MSLIVQKYGGTSVGNPERIMNVARRVIATQDAGHRVVVVVSAMSGVTDSLIKLSKQVSQNPSEREMDVLLATGEQTTIALTAMAIHGLGRKAVSLTGAQAGIITDGVHTKAKIANITPKQVHDYLKKDHIVIVAGFQGETTRHHHARPRWLGPHGGAIAAAIGRTARSSPMSMASILTTTRRALARKIDSISYGNARNASSGSVMQSRSVGFARNCVVFGCAASTTTREPSSKKKPKI